LILPAHRFYADLLHCAQARQRHSNSHTRHSSHASSSVSSVVVLHRASNRVLMPKPEASGGFQLMFMHEYCG
jgi:hypothetical protein